MSFVCGQVTAVERADFDATYTMHVQMNVADKSGFFHAIASRLGPGGRLATFEVCRSGSGNPATPLPWSLDGTGSWLATPDELLTCIQGSGFESHVWVDETAWVLRWFQELTAGSAVKPGAAMLPALLTDGPTRMVNFAEAVRKGTLTVYRGAFTLALAPFIGSR